MAHPSAPAIHLPNPILFYLILEVRTWLEGRDLVLRDDHCGILGDVSAGLSLSGLHFECAEASEINVLLLCKRALHCFHESFYHCAYCRVLDTGAL